MKNLFLFLLFAVFSIGATAQPYVFPDEIGQFWNTSNGYYGLVNAGTVDGGTFLDTVNNTTGYVGYAKWPSKSGTGVTIFDSARILKKNPAPSSGGYYIPYSYGMDGHGQLSLTVVTYKASKVSSVNPTVVCTPQQSSNGIDGWNAIPGVTALTLTPTSRTAAVTATINIQYIYTKYTRMQIASTDTSSVRVTYDYKRYTN